ncbi:MAG: DUF934 domain-containing protein [Rhodocyclaceae bacterium]|nr:DUF934 domain-containing protein [Rhodocyclaceae bacterium]
MAKIIKHGTVARDTHIRFDASDFGELDGDPSGDWHDGGALPPGGLIVPLAVWLKYRAALRLSPRTGVLLSPGDDPALLAEDLQRLRLVAVDFPKFTDGRGLSTGRLLRERFGYQGELRAVGHILPDQVYFLSRAGFDAFELPEERVDDALASLQPFTAPYQGAVDQPPLFLRRVA